MKATLSIEEFSELAKHVYKNYGMLSPTVPKGARHVKYMQCNIDFRDGRVFYVKIYGMGVEKEFLTVNQYRNHPKTLKERILDYVNGIEDNYEKTNIQSTAN